MFCVYVIDGLYNIVIGGGDYYSWCIGIGCMGCLLHNKYISVHLSRGFGDGVSFILGMHMLYINIADNIVESSLVMIHIS